MAVIDRKFCNVLLLGLGFMFVFTAFQTMGNIEQTVLESIRLEDPDFKGDGYTSLAIIYAVFSLSNWLAPSVISATGPRFAIFIGALAYVFFIASFLLPSTWLLYVASTIIGLGAAVIWTGQGNYLTLNSPKEVMSRNSGIFWAMLQMSMFFGNLFVFFQFQGKTEIDAHTRKVVFWALLGVALFGLVFILVLRPAPRLESDEKELNLGPLEALKESFRLFATRDMLLLSFTFFYTGLELSFYSGVYSPSIGFTLELGEEAKQLVGLSGIFIGVGEVLGGTLFGILGKKTNQWGRDPIVIVGFVIHTVAFFLIFLNIPNSAPLGNTHDVGFIDPIPALAIFCSFLLGFGDSCYNTQIYSILGGVFTEKSAEAFALFKFTQSVAAAIAFFYAPHAGLYTQLGILIFFATLGTITFVRVEQLGKRQKRLDDEKLSHSSQ